jgi:hypothetical protein
MEKNGWVQKVMSKLESLKKVRGFTEKEAKKILETLLEANPKYQKEVSCNKKDGERGSL